MPKQKAAQPDQESDSEGEETVDYSCPDGGLLASRLLLRPLRRQAVSASRACREGRGGEGGFR